MHCKSYIQRVEASCIICSFFAVSLHFVLCWSTVLTSSYFVSWSYSYDPFIPENGAWRRLPPSINTFLILHLNILLSADSNTSTLHCYLTLWENSDAFTIIEYFHFIPRKHILLCFICYAYSLSWDLIWSLYTFYYYFVTPTGHFSLRTHLIWGPTKNISLQQ